MTPPDVSSLRGLMALVVIVVGQFGIYLFFKKWARPYVCSELGLELSDFELGWMISACLGFLEEIMYAVAFVMNQPAWVAVWLTLKAAGSWKKWVDAPVRTTYDLFLVGNALSILVGLAAAWVWLGHMPAFPIVAVVSSSSR